MEIIEAMDYRFENPNQNVDVDVKIAEALISRPRAKHALEFFESWASMSKNKEKIFSMIDTYKQMVIENEANKTR